MRIRKSSKLKTYSSRRNKTFLSSQIKITFVILLLVGSLFVSIYFGKYSARATSYKSQAVEPTIVQMTPGNHIELNTTKSKVMDPGYITLPISFIPSRGYEFSTWVKLQDFSGKKNTILHWPINADVALSLTASITLKDEEKDEYELTIDFSAPDPMSSSKCYQKEFSKKLIISSSQATGYIFLQGVVALDGQMILYIDENKYESSKMVGPSTSSCMSKNPVIIGAKFTNDKISQVLVGELDDIRFSSSRAREFDKIKILRNRRDDNPSIPSDIFFFRNNGVYSNEQIDDSSANGIVGKSSGDILLVPDQNL